MIVNERWEEPRYALLKSISRIRNEGKIRSLIKQHKIDCVHSLCDMAIKPGRLSKRLKVPFVNLFPENQAIDNHEFYAQLASEYSKEVLDPSAHPVATNKQNKRKGLLLRGLELLLVITALVGTSASLVTTRDYRIESFCHRLTDNYNHSYSDFVPPIVEMKYKSIERNSDNYRKAYQYLENSLQKSYARIITDGPLRIQSDTYGTYSVPMISQKTFGSVLRSNGYYSIDGGFYYTYFKSGFSGQFFYITDTLADKLIEEIATAEIKSKSKAEQYQALIDLQPTFSLTPNTPAATAYPFVVRGVINTQLGSAPRAIELYGDFILSYELCSARHNRFEYHYEYEPKLNTWGNKTIFNAFSALYADSVNELAFSFKTFEKSSKAYVENASLTKEFAPIWEQKQTMFFLIPLLISLILFVGLEVSLSKALAQAYDFSGRYLLSLIGIILVYGLLSNFIYFYTGFGIVFLTTVLFDLIMNRKQILRITKKLYFKATKGGGIALPNDKIKI